MKYNKEANSVISINLHNGYFIIAMTKWNNECRKYFTTLYIKHKTVDILDKLENFTNVECTTTSAKEINNEVAELVIDKFKSNQANLIIISIGMIIIRNALIKEMSFSKTRGKINNV